MVTTPSAEHFFNKHDIDCVVYTDNHEWNQWSKIGDPVLHIEVWIDSVYPSVPFPFVL